MKRIIIGATLLIWGGYLLFTALLLPVMNCNQIEPSQRKCHLEIRLAGWIAVPVELFAGVAAIPTAPPEPLPEETRASPAGETSIPIDWANRGLKFLVGTVLLLVGLSMTGPFLLSKLEHLPPANFIIQTLAKLTVPGLAAHQIIANGCLGVPIAFALMGFGGYLLFTASSSFVGVCFGLVFLLLGILLISPFFRQDQVAKPRKRRTKKS